MNSVRSIEEFIYSLKNNDEYVKEYTIGGVKYYELIIYDNFNVLITDKEPTIENEYILCIGTGGHWRNLIRYEHNYHSHRSNSYRLIVATSNTYLSKKNKSTHDCAIYKER